MVMRLLDKALALERKKGSREGLPFSLVKYEG